MVRKRVMLSSTGFFLWDVAVYLRECPNVVRWNPRLAIDWMEHLSSHLYSDYQRTKYNRVARQMNTFLDKLETRRYYRKEDYWANDRVRRVPLVEDYTDIMPDDYDEDFEDEIIRT
jgi:predicted transglutaminase-like cysteine proteinase